METHHQNTMSTEAAAPVAPVESAPVSQENSAPDSFGSSLDSFFAQTDAELAQIPDLAPPAAVKPDEATPKTADPAEKTPETPVADPLEEVDNFKEWTPQAARRFKEIKAEAKQAKLLAQEQAEQLKQREARLAELEAIANDPKVKDLTSRAEEYEQAMLLRDLENSHAYKTLVREPLERITSEIDALAAKYSVSGDDLIDVVVMDDETMQEERLGELLASASDRDKFRLYKLIEETKPVLEQRATLQANAREAMQELQELDRQREQMTLVERAQQRSVAAQEVSKRIEKSLPFITTFDGVDLPSLAKQAGEVDYSKLDPTLGTYNTMAGHLLPKLANQYIALQRELASMADKLAEYDRMGAPLNSGFASGHSPSSAGEGKSFLEAIESQFPSR
jgi:hypothetical protein